MSCVCGRGRPRSDDEDKGFEEMATDFSPDTLGHVYADSTTSHHVVLARPHPSNASTSECPAIHLIGGRQGRRQLSMPLIRLRKKLLLWVP